MVEESGIGKAEIQEFIEEVELADGDELRIRPSSLITCWRANEDRQVLTRLLAVTLRW
jgi:hypothetical protein